MKLWIKKIFTKYTIFKWSILRTYWFIKKLLKKDDSTKTTSDSYDIYQNYNDREQIEYENDSSKMLYNNLIVNMSWKEARLLYLDNIFIEIDSLLKKKKNIKILEVGCGNCINIVNIKKKYGHGIDIVGLDISDERINVAKRYFSPFLDNIEFKIFSITEKTKFADNEFDMVFSMHCLEQIAYDSKKAVSEMYRITNNRLLMIEPIFENGTFLQKLYLIDSDHNRVLLKNILELKLPITTNEILKIQKKS